MRIFFFILLITTCCFTITAQIPPGKVYELISDTLTRQEINNSYWQVLDDTEGNWTIDDVVKDPLKSRFFQKGPGHSAGSVLAKAHRLRYSITNTMNRAADICFMTGSEKSDFYIVRKNNERSHYITGDGYSWSKKDGFKKANAVPWSLHAGEEVTIYQRRFNSRPDSVGSNTKLVLLSTEKLKNAEFREYQENFIPRPAIFTSFISGLFFLAAIFNLLIFWQLKEKENLYFSLFLVSMFFLYSPIFGELIGRENKKLGESFNLAGIFFVIFFVLFVRTYFELSMRYPKWDKFLTFLSYILSIILILDLFPIHVVVDKIKVVVRQILIISYIAALVVTVFLGIRKGGRKTKIFIKAVLPFLFFLIVPVILVLMISAFNNEFSPSNWENIWNYVIGATIVWATCVFSTYLYKNYGQQQQKIMEGLLLAERMEKDKEREKNEFILLQKEELEKQVTERTFELRNSLEVLKSTQSQLIQSEKMASLGELTAGIAHEIQNPLNFVNNFSEVNAELLTELKAEISAGGKEEAIGMVDDILENEKKINHHGKRADGIVKGMLLHSRKTSGEKELVDLNAFANEWLRLAYHGIRAKDNSFNAVLITNFDTSAGKINIIAQDIGRVLLNIFNNAFYAVNEGNRSLVPGYEPTVWLQTNRLDNSVEITVKDNGNGIPDKIKDKIFQPFFTTKPTGQGTGLGLSLSYDIIKSHSGSLTVKSEEGQGSEFIISLPA